MTCVNEDCTMIRVESPLVSATYKFFCALEPYVHHFVCSLLGRSDQGGV